MPSYIEHLAELSNTGQPFISVTLVETLGSVPQDSGNKMLVDATGLVWGTIGGGKVEAQAIAEAQRMLADRSEGQNRLVEWNLQSDIGMTCGGVVKLYFEVYNRDDWRVVVFGAGHVAQALIRCLHPLDCRITCIDSRKEWLERLPQRDRLDCIVSDDPASLVSQWVPGASVACMTMGHSTDLPILASIFSQRIQPSYLGVIGSRSKRKLLIRELIASGMDESSIGDFCCPIGLPAGSNQPAEIAISIVAQMLQYRDGLRHE